ncbi:MAG: HlyD family secretion protein, partial [Gammaproteobacteria bacterium]
DSMFFSCLRNYIILILLSLFLVSCVIRSHQTFPGYIEGEYTYISSEASGTLVNLQVKRGENVSKGEPLYQLDLEPEASALSAAKSRVDELKVQLDLAEVQYQRQLALIQTSATSKVAYDIAAAAYHARKNQYDEAQAQFLQAEWRYSQKNISSPVSGMVFDTFFRVGENVGLHQPVLAILVPENIKVLFYIPEAQLSSIHIGQTIYFSCDGCRGKTKSVISYISPEAEYTPPVIYSKDTRTKLVYMVRADMLPDVAKNFHPGQPVDVYLHE